MPETTDTYASAVRDLADALADVWQACEAGYDHQRGLGTASCGPDTLPQYQIPPGKYNFTFVLQPSA